ncbi:MAG: zinc-binding dehydrogenase [Planctomycetota bacterium]
MQNECVVITGERAVELQPMELDETLGAGEILVETECTFISAGTELSIYTGTEAMARQPGAWSAWPFACGYANVGRGRAVGEGVSTFAPGDRVFSLAGHGRYAKLSTDALLVPVPSELGPDIAVASRMAGVATTAVTVAAFGMDPWVVVFGLGMVGNLAAQACRIQGGRVIGVDPVASRRTLAETCGIPHTTGGDAETVRADIERITGGAMAAITVEAVGHTGVIRQALGVTADFGQLVLLGTPRAPVETDATAFFNDIHLRWITVRGALEWNLPLYPGKGLEGQGIGASLYAKQNAIFDWIVRGELRIEPLVSHRVPPEEVKAAYEGLLNEPETYTGVVLDWR